jgi:signal transduction histidine kinase
VDPRAAEFLTDIATVARIGSVPTILDVVCRTTGMGFAAVARVTGQRWIACSVHDEIAFGLKPGGELKVETTICHEIEQSRKPVVIDHVAEDSNWCGHPCPAMYGFQSYISVPIILADGSFFGTLCAIDPKPARLNTPEVLGMFRLFAELIAKHLNDSRRLTEAESALVDEREASRLREQFIAILGHDLRSPVRAVRTFGDMLLTTRVDPRQTKLVHFIRDAGLRMQALIDNMLDLARGRLGGGIKLTRESTLSLKPLLETIIAELTASTPDRLVDVEFALMVPVNCDRSRIAQLFTNLLTNAFAHGAANHPIRVRASSNEEVFELSVSNPGEPIPAAAFAHLFEPFYRGAIKGHPEGLGLGLYISHEIAVAHGGTLGVTSTEKETCFTFRMPNVGAV